MELRNYFLGVVAVAMTFGVASPAQALLIDIEIVNATWTNIIGGGSTLSGAGTNRISWGGTTNAGGGNQSSYQFSDYAPISGIALDTPFALGKFIHHNYVIRGPAIRAAELVITANLLLRDGATTTRLNEQGPFNFRFLHRETPNDCDSRGCSRDIVRLASLDSIDNFTFNGAAYSLDLTGFMRRGQITDVFRTRENRRNSADLMAVFTSVTAVPEPASLALVLGGLAGIAFTRRRVFLPRFLAMSDRR